MTSDLDNDLVRGAPHGTALPNSQLTSLARPTASLRKASRSCDHKKMQGDFCDADNSQLPIRAGDHNPVAAYRRGGTHGLWTGPVPNGVLISDCASGTDYQTECLSGQGVFLSIPGSLAAPTRYVAVRALLGRRVLCRDRVKGVGSVRTEDTVWTISSRGRMWVMRWSNSVRTVRGLDPLLGW